MFDTVVKNLLRKRQTLFEADDKTVDDAELEKRTNDLYNHDPLAPKTSQKDVEEKMELAEYNLANIYPAFGMMQIKTMNIVYNHPDIKTAAVDQSGNFYVNTDFISKLSQKEILGLMIHEIAHIAMRDLFRMPNGDPKILNIASDLVNNWWIYNDGKANEGAFALPPGALLPDIADGILKKISGKEIPQDKGINLNNESKEIPQDKWINLNNESMEEVYEKLKNLSPELINQLNSKRWDVHITAKTIREVESGGGQANVVGEQGEDLMGAIVRDKVTGNMAVVIADNEESEMVGIIPITEQELETITAETFFKNKGKI